MICNECGAEVKEGARICGYCGSIVPEIAGQSMQFEDADRYSFEYCKRCKTRIVDRSENPNSVLCRQCREELIHYPIPKWIFAVAAGVLFLLVFSFMNFPENLKSYRIVEGAAKRADEGYIFSALSDMNEVLEQHPDSIKTAVQMTDIAMEHGYYDYAVYALNTYLVGEEVSDTVYAKLDNYSMQLERYYNTYDAYEAMLSEYTEVDEAAMNATLEQLEALLDDTNYDPATVYYYMGYMSQEDDKRCEYFEKCYELDGTYTDAASQAGNSYRRAGELGKARELIMSAYEEDKESSSVVRSLAVLEMLEGNLKDGLNLAKEAYELNPDEYYVADTYVIAIAANGDMEAAKAQKKSFEAEGYEFDEELEKFLEGKYTLEEYYIG